MQLILVRLTVTLFWLTGGFSYVSLVITGDAGGVVLAWGILLTFIRVLVLLPAGLRNGLGPELGTPTPVS